ncbi:hypothetical protein BaRGS_00031779 [Batillaria attramentaria]|uniref:Transposase n=1 Tax=Batillaria attramentaria TaxID=370345 RepID=A0ABD0JQ84_9CAEN
MERRRMSEEQRWQIIGMHSTGMTCRAIGRQLGYQTSVISRMITKHAETNTVKDRPRSGRPRVTTQREDRALYRLVRQQRFASSSHLKRQWLPNRQLPTKSVRNRLRATSIALRARRVIKRPLLTDHHKRLRLAWCLARQHWNLRNWRKIHWSDESRFLLHVTDGRARVWRQPNTAYAARNIIPSVPHGGGSVMVWGCISHDCKQDLVTIRGNLTGDRYIREVLQPAVVPHFDAHPLATRPVFMDDNARPHRSRAVAAYLQQEAATALPWPAISADLNPLEHVWDLLGRRIQSLDPPVQNLHELEAALHREWQQLTIQHIRHLTRRMRRRVQAVISVQGGYTRY